MQASSRVAQPNTRGVARLDELGTHGTVSARDERHVYDNVRLQPSADPIRGCVRASTRGAAVWQVRAWYVRPTTNARVQLSRTSRGSAPSLSQIVRVPHGAAVGELPIKAEARYQA